MEPARPCIGNCERRGRCELALDVQIVLIDVIALDIGIPVAVLPALSTLRRRKRPRHQVRNRIRPGAGRNVEILPAVVLVLTDHRKEGLQWSVSNQTDIHLVSKGQDVKQSETAPDGRLAVAERIPGKTNSRIEVFRCDVAGQNLVGQVRGRARDRVQVRHSAVFLRRESRHLVAESQVQSQVRTEAPIVLEVSADNVVANVALIDIRIIGVPTGPEGMVRQKSQERPGCA